MDRCCCYHFLSSFQFCLFYKWYSPYLEQTQNQQREHSANKPEFPTHINWWSVCSDTSCWRAAPHMYWSYRLINLYRAVLCRWQGRGAVKYRPHKTFCLTKRKESEHLSNNTVVYNIIMSNEEYEEGEVGGWPDRPSTPSANFTSIL